MKSYHSILIRYMSSKSWMERHVRDTFVKQSRYQNYRSRAAFKLIEMNDRYRLLKPGMIVIECGAAPGSWTQVIVECLRLNPPECYKTGAVIALDKADFAPIPGAICLPKTDFTSHISQANILSALSDRKADLILSDMSPNVSGQHDYDHERIMQLVYSTIRFSSICLKDQGNFLAKIFNGNQTEKLIEDLSKMFQKVRQVKPEASRADSTELYVLATGFKGRENQIL
ncbi:mitochondrial rRNA methyltransferase 2 [Dermatophagoides pteronyssinus]|uniref:mitochondrial rRNA methyltransferase 2 n=1 Tax=Dermatophagoides pteronyssinus TaxID=6956 RepID=UPI003F66A760